MRLFCFICTSIFIGSAFANFNYFIDDYEQSRARFRAHSENLANEYGGVQSEHFSVSLSEDLTVDSIYIPARVSGGPLFVLVSGVHGTEAAAGAAIQEQFIREQLPLWKKTGVLETTSILMVHAMNPWGFKNHRRTTETSIDLNRNFAYTPEVFYTINPVYEKAKSLLQSSTRLNCTFAKEGQWLKFGLSLLSGLKTEDLEIAIGQGQYVYPRGLGYGGRAREPQVDFFSDILRRVLPGHSEVIAFDLHTGLGEKRQLHLILSETMSEDTADFFETFYRASHVNKSLVLTNPLTEHGFYPTSGDFNEFVEQIAGELSVPARALTVEFGTVGTDFLAQGQTARILIQENRGYHNGYSSRRCQRQVSQEYRELFLPESEKWRQAVLSKAKHAIGVMGGYFQK